MKRCAPVAKSPRRKPVLCASCHPGYHLTRRPDRKCRPNKCRCPNGIPTRGEDCPHRGFLKCSSCSMGYSLLPLHTALHNNTNFSASHVVRSCQPTPYVLIKRGSCQRPAGIAMAREDSRIGTRMPTTAGAKGWRRVWLDFVYTAEECVEAALALGFPKNAARRKLLHTGGVTPDLDLMDVTVENLTTLLRVSDPVLLGNLKPTNRSGNGSNNSSKTSATDRSTTTTTTTMTTTVSFRKNTTTNSTKNLPTATQPRPDNLTNKTVPGSPEAFFDSRYDRPMRWYGLPKFCGMRGSGRFLHFNLRHKGGLYDSVSGSFAEIAAEAEFGGIFKDGEGESGRRGTENSETWQICKIVDLRRTKRKLKVVLNAFKLPSLMNDFQGNESVVIV